jgi:hypothetical protein
LGALRAGDRAFDTQGKEELQQWKGIAALLICCIITKKNESKSSKRRSDDMLVGMSTFQEATLRIERKTTGKEWLLISGRQTS